MPDSLWNSTSVPPIPQLALRPTEAANALGVSPRTLWAWTSSGAVPHVRVGRTVLYSVDVLRDWLNRKSGAPEGGEDVSC